MAGSFDRLLLGSVLLLLLGGTAMLYSATSLIAYEAYGNSFTLLYRHLGRVGLGLLVMLGAMYLPYAYWQRALRWLLGLSLALLLAVLIPGLGHEVGGASRWLRLGSFQFQPSEWPLKLTLIVFCASYLSRRQAELASFLRGLAPSLGVVGVFLLLVMLQPDFGTAALLTSVVLSLIFVGGGRPLHLLGSCAGLLLLGGLAIFGASYRLQRLLAFLDPWADPHRAGFQIIQSYIAMGSGGLFGRGLGESGQKNHFLPDAHTDFIFAILAEELGLVGVMLTMALFAVFVWRGLVIALRCDDAFGRLLAVGLTASLGLQALTNMGVVLGLLPTTGLPLPFISYGGSALVNVLWMSGILLSISRETSPSRSGR